MNRRRTLAIALSVAVAAIGTILLIAATRGKGSSKAVAPPEPTAKVWVVSEVVPNGTKGGDIANYVRQQVIPARLRIPEAVGGLDEVAGLVTSADLLIGEQLVKTRFTTPQNQERGGVAPQLLEVSLQLAADRSVGGKLTGGGVDTVAVFASLGKAEDDQGKTIAGEQTHLIAHKVPVIRVAGGATASADGTAKGDASAVPTSAVLVTLGLTGPNAERVVFAIENGHVWLAREPSDAPEGETKLVDRINIWDDVATADVTVPKGAASATAPDTAAAAPNSAAIATAKPTKPSTPVTRSPPGNTNSSVSVP